MWLYPGRLWLPCIRETTCLMCHMCVLQTYMVHVASTGQMLWNFKRVHMLRVSIACTYIRGNHLSNTPCPTHVFFKSGT